MIKISTPLLIVLMIQVFIIGLLTEHTLRYDDLHKPKVDLPEEYKLITKDTPIRGHFDKDSTLVIEFNYYKYK